MASNRTSTPRQEASKPAPPPPGRKAPDPDAGGRPTGGRRFTSLKRVSAIFEQVLESSPADETELVWFERRHDAAATDGSGTHSDEPRLTVLVRVVEGSRIGWHRTDVADPALLTNAVRHSLAMATVRPKDLRRPALSTDDQPLRTDLPLRDEEIEQLTPGRAEARLRQWCGDATGRLHWSRTRLVVWNSHGVRRHAMTTEASLQMKVGGGAHAGYAAASARRLADLAPELVLERARQRQTDAALVAVPESSVPVVLSPEAMIELLDLVNTFAFAGSTYLDGSSFLSQHRNVQVFDRAVHVRDDGGRLPGMPFPFDLEGSIKKPVDLIVEGRPSTPALSRSQSGRAGLDPTGQSVGGDEAMFGNLFLLPGGIDDSELLQRAEGGLFISWLERPECYEPKRLEVRTVARGVRRIENGKLGPPLPDLVWETSLLAALARLAGIGRHAVVRAMPSTPLGGISAPAVGLADAGGFTPLPAR